MASQTGTEVLSVAVESVESAEPSARALARKRRKHAHT